MRKGSEGKCRSDAEERDGYGGGAVVVAVAVASAVRACHMHHIRVLQLDFHTCIQNMPILVAVVVVAVVVVVLVLHLVVVAA